jgi:hypothetical protein
VASDGEVLFSKRHEDGFPEEHEILAKLRSTSA